MYSYCYHNFYVSPFLVWRDVMKSGIYTIEINNKFYVGYSKNIKSRWADHKRKLAKNKHRNYHLQLAYNKHQEAKYEVLEETTEWIQEKEVMWIEKIGYYNKTEGGEGGDIASKLPPDRVQKWKKLISRPRNKNGAYKDIGYTNEQLYEMYLQKPIYGVLAKELGFGREVIRRRIKWYCEDNNIPIPTPDPKITHNRAENNRRRAIHR